MKKHQMKKSLPLLVSTLALVGDVSANESVSRDFIDRLEHLGVVLDSEGYHTWGTSVVQGDDGKFHMYACQWPTKFKFSSWSKESIVNYYTAQKPEGPYQFEKQFLVRGPVETRTASGIDIRLTTRR